MESLDHYRGIKEDPVHFEDIVREYARAASSTSVGAGAFHDTGGCIDTVIKKKVFKLENDGSKITIPGENTKGSIKARGRYAYIQLRPLRNPDAKAARAGRPYLPHTFSIDCLNHRETIYRLVFSTEFTAGGELRTGRIAHVPLPQPTSDRWMVYSIDLPGTLAVVTGGKEDPAAYVAVCGVQFLSSCHLRGIFTTDRILSGDMMQNTGMAFPLPPNTRFEALYGEHWLPHAPKPLDYLMAGRRTASSGGGAAGKSGSGVGSSRSRGGASGSPTRRKAAAAGGAGTSTSPAGSPTRGAEDRSAADAVDASAADRAEDGSYEVADFALSVSDALAVLSTLDAEAAAIAEAVAAGQLSLPAPQSPAAATRRRPASPSPRRRPWAETPPPHSALSLPTRSPTNTSGGRSVRFSSPPIGQPIHTPMRASPPASSGGRLAGDVGGSVAAGGMVADTGAWLSSPPALSRSSLRVTGTAIRVGPSPSLPQQRSPPGDGLPSASPTAGAASADRGHCAPAGVSADSHTVSAPQAPSSTAAAAETGVPSAPVALAMPAPPLPEASTPAAAPVTTHAVTPPATAQGSRRTAAATRTPLARPPSTAGTGTPAALRGAGAASASKRVSTPMAAAATAASSVRRPLSAARTPPASGHNARAASAARPSSMRKAATPAPVAAAPPAAALDASTSAALADATSPETATEQLDASGAAAAAAALAAAAPAAPTTPPRYYMVSPFSSRRLFDASHLESTVLDRELIAAGLYTPPPPPPPPPEPKAAASIRPRRVNRYRAAQAAAGADGGAAGAASGGASAASGVDSDCALTSGAGAMPVPPSVHDQRPTIAGVGVLSPADAARTSLASPAYSPMRPAAVEARVPAAGAGAAGCAVADVSAAGEHAVAVAPA